MITSKLKAEELVNSFDELGRDFTRGVSMKEFAKQCALITVDEILNDENEFIQTIPHHLYWERVKTEIEKL